MEKTIDITHDKITALISDGKVAAGVKYVGNLPANLKIAKDTFGKLIKGTEYWEFHPVLKSAKVYETLTAGTELKVYPEHNFGAGDTFYYNGTQSTISAVTLGSDTDIDYDVLTIGSTTIPGDTIITQEENPETAYVNYKNIVAVGSDVHYTEAQRVNDDIFVYVVANKVYDFYLLPNYMNELSATPLIGSLNILPLLSDVDQNVSSKGYKEYVALLTQSGTAAPVATVLVNELDELPTFSYSDVGVFTFDAVAEIFTSGKTFISTQPVGTEADPNSIDRLALARVISEKQIKIVTTNTSFAGANGALTNSEFAIRVYN